MPGQEYWQLSILDNTLNQIDSLADQNGFAEPDGPHFLRQQLLDMLDRQEEMAESTSKGEGGAPWVLYFNEMMHTNNVFLLNADEVQQVYFTFDNLNFLVSQQPEFCQYAMDWFQVLQHHSRRVSGEGKRVRKRFFERLRGRVKQAMGEGGNE